MSAAGVRGVLAGTWTNLIGYQIVWFIAVAGAGRGQAWPAVVAMADDPAARPAWRECAR